MADRITIKPRANHRVGVFVDMQNLYHSAKNLYNARVNFAELMKLAVQDRQVVRALVYVVKGGESAEEKSSSCLEKSGLELKMKESPGIFQWRQESRPGMWVWCRRHRVAKQFGSGVLVTGDGTWDHS